MNTWKPEELQTQCSINNTKILAIVSFSLFVKEDDVTLYIITLKQNVPIVLGVKIKLENEFNQS